MTEWDEREDGDVSDGATRDSTSDRDDSASDSADEDLHQVAATVEDDDLADSSIEAASDGQDGVSEEQPDVENLSDQPDQPRQESTEDSASASLDASEPADIDGDDWTVATGETAEGREKALERLGRGQEVPGGLAFYEPGDATFLAAKDLPALEGHRTYDLHGSTSSVDIAGEDVGPREFADVVRADPNWNGQPVNLFSCDTGKEPEGGGPPFGQLLSDELGTSVRAPTELAWSGADGVPFVMAGQYDPETEDFQPCPPPGEFRMFYPRERTGV